MGKDARFWKRRYQDINTRVAHEWIKSSCAGEQKLSLLLSHFLFNFLSYIIHPLFLSLQNKTPRLVPLICKGIPFGRSVYALPFVDEGTSLASIMFSTRALAALAVAFSPLALAATLISDDTMINYLNAGGLDLAYANSPFVTPPYSIGLPIVQINWWWELSFRVWFFGQAMNQPPWYIQLYSMTPYSLQIFLSSSSRH